MADTDAFAANKCFFLIPGLATTSNSVRNFPAKEQARLPVNNAGKRNQRTKTIGVDGKTLNECARGAKRIRNTGSARRRGKGLRYKI
jgi:hypothetical protein